MPKKLTQQITVKIEGLSKLQKSLDKFEKNLPKLFEQAVLDAVQKVTK